LVAVVAVVADVADVAVDALPDKVAVMVPALKLPEASRATIALAVFALVAVVAELGILVDAVKAPVPLPYTYPVSVVAPVPPAATGNVPAARAEALVEYNALLAAVNVVRPVPPYPDEMVPPFHVPLVRVAVPKSAVEVLKLYDAGRSAYLPHEPADVEMLSAKTYVYPPDGTTSTVAEALSTIVTLPLESLSNTQA
jgi:hypothetical protein